MSIFNKNIRNKNFKISENEIRNYLNLNDSEKIEFENKYKDDKFISEALEGYKSSPESINKLKEINNIIEKKSSPYKINNSSSKIFKTILLTSIIGIASIVFFIILLNKLNNNTTSKNETIFIEEKYFYPKSIESLPISENINIEIKSNTKQINSKLKNKIVRENIEQIELKGTSVLNLNDLEKKQLQKLNRSNTAINYLLDLKIVDYSKRNNSIFENNNIEAKFENNELNNSISSGIKESKTYNDLLYQALSNINTKNYSTAISIFNEILSVFDDDMNAIFYSALCNTYLNNYDIAIIGFDKCIASNINTFYEEALWYKAVNLLNKGEKTEAINILNQIISEQGFYSNKAKLKLNEINN